MGRYILSRLVDTVVTVLGVSVIVFMLTQLTGDPARLMLPADAREAQVQELRDRLGLNDPLPIQYVRFLSGALRGDFGISLRSSQPALQLVFDRMPATLLLAVGSLIFSVILGGIAGLVSATKRGTWLDTAMMLLALIGQAVPVFWLAMMLILVVAVQWRLAPTSGIGTPAHAILPIVTLGAYSSASIARLLRASLLSVLANDYIRTARSKGLAERLILYRHALRNALIPVVTVVGLQFGTMLGGAVITETIFAWPGVGRLAIQSIYVRDFPVVQATVFIVAVGFVFINLLVDLTYALLDPRIRLAR
jgi:ABC-type dipeptide/oligopeptide/nickel transport system permease component